MEAKRRLAPKASRKLIRTILLFLHDKFECRRMNHLFAQGGNLIEKEFPKFVSLENAQENPSK